MASAVNPLDLKILADIAEHLRQSLPIIFGIEMAGGVGGHPGSLAEFVSVDERLVACKPANLSLRETAAVPLAFITAWERLVDRADVHAVQRVFVRSGAGGTGQMALQIARARGTITFATGSSSARETIEGLRAIFVRRGNRRCDVVGGTLFVARNAAQRLRSIL